MQPAGGRSESGRPEAQVDVPRHQHEVTIGGEHREIVTKAQLREERVDRPDLDTAAAAVAQLGGLDMVGTVGHEQRQR